MIGTDAKMIEALKALDAVIHGKSRLKILSILRRTGGSDYLFVRHLTGLSMANLSSHLAKLEQTGLVSLHKHFEGKKPVTTLGLTKEGRAAMDHFWLLMETAERNSRPEGAEQEAWWTRAG